MRAASRGGGGAMDYSWVADGNSKPPARRGRVANNSNCGSGRASGGGRPATFRVLPRCPLLLLLLLAAASEPRRRFE